MKILAKNSHSHRPRGATKTKITLPMVNTGFGLNTFHLELQKCGVYFLTM